MKLQDMKFWFLVGSQYLYGSETLKEINVNSKHIVASLNSMGVLPCEIEYKSIVKTAEEATDLMLEANYTKNCAGIIVFCHTFSPSKMWINALKNLQKPYLHFHTQFNDSIPNEELDMDYMNLHQSAHGDREHSFISVRLGISRKIIVGYWKNNNVQKKISKWMRAAAGALFSRQLKVMRFGDNMREVGVTEGDKVEAQSKFGWQVNTWPVGDLVKYSNLVKDDDISKKIDEYNSKYSIDTENLDSIKYQAKIEIAIKRMLDNNGCKAFTNTFEDLHGMMQLPGLSTQNLMAEGFGYGGEGDWKTAAMTSIMKFMSTGMSGGTSFIEDYTYDMVNELVLGSHMLEVCPSIAATKPIIKVYPLNIGAKKDPARLVFNGKSGNAILVSLIDLGRRFRLIVHDINCIKIKQNFPNLPTARIMWKPKPNFSKGIYSWMLAGGSHHSTLSFDLDVEMIRDWARIMNIEFIHINENTDPDELENNLLHSDLIWNLKNL